MEDKEIITIKNTGDIPLPVYKSDKMFDSGKLWFTLEPGQRITYVLESEE
jgi:hypothetical protein